MESPSGMIAHGVPRAGHGLYGAAPSPLVASAAASTGFCVEASPASTAGPSMRPELASSTVVPPLPAEPPEPPPAPPLEPVAPAIPPPVGPDPEAPEVVPLDAEPAEPPL